MSCHSHRPTADNFDMAGLGSTSRSMAAQRRRQREGGRPRTMKVRPRPAICISQTGENSEQGQEQCRLLMEILERLNSLEVPGAEDVPLNKLSNQDQHEGSEQSDQAELAFPMPRNTSSPAQASPPCHRLCCDAKMSSDEDNAEMCPGRMSAPPANEHGRNQSIISLPQQKPSSVQTRGRNWTNLEDQLLIQAHGTSYRRKKECWTDIASNIPRRTGDQCRLRWDTLLRNYRKVHLNQGRSKEEYFQDLLCGRVSCGQGESGQRDQLQEQEGKNRKKRKNLENDVAQNSHSKRERLFEVHEITSILQGILKIQERVLELMEQDYNRKTAGVEQAISQGDGLQAAEVGIPYWPGGQGNFVMPLHQDSVGQIIEAFPVLDCERVPQLNFNDI